MCPEELKYIVRFFQRCVDRKEIDGALNDDVSVPRHLLAKLLPFVIMPTKEGDQVGSHLLDKFLNASDLLTRSIPVQYESRKNCRHYHIRFGSTSTENNAPIGNLTRRK